MKFYKRLCATACVLFATASYTAAGERFVPCEGLSVYTSATPTEAEALALTHFVQEVQRFTGETLPQQWGGAFPEGRRLLIAGNWGSILGQAEKAGFRTAEWTLPAVDEADILNQSFLLETLPGAGHIAAVGCGAAATPRGFLGLGYALGELLRRVEQREGVWGFALPDTPIVASPAMPNRTLYLMNSNHMNPGLSLEFFSEEELEGYIDFLIDARYSRVSLWQWTSNQLYPGNFEENRARNQMTHRAMRHLFQYAQRRGLQVFHQLAPMHANVDLLPDDPKFVATGYYGRNSICWAQPEGRELARLMARSEMEYYGPVDGYIVWFYDPGGCFCAVCHENQGQHLFEQFTLIHDLAQTISPGAEFQAVLWPTWCFQDYNTRGIPYESVEEVQTFVREFLAKMLEAYGPRNIHIMDTTELEISNLYNGLVKPEEFKRTAFMYSVMGLPSESAYPFTAFRLGDLVEVMGTARDRGVEDANFFIQYAATNMPSVFTLADTLYLPETTAEASAGRYAAHIAKGDAREKMQQILLGLDVLYAAETHAAKEAELVKIEALAEALRGHPQFFGNHDWLRGQILAQRHYMNMARASGEEAFLVHYNKLREEVGAIPMYAHYLQHYINRNLAEGHVKTYWGGRIDDREIVGLPPAE